MSTTNILFLNFAIHSLALGAIGWLLVRFAIRDALRRCIVANVAVLFCLIAPFNIFMQDLFPTKQAVPMWTPLQETFEADWRVTVAHAPAPTAPTAAMLPKPAWSLDFNVVLSGLRWVVYAGIALMLGRLLLQTVRVQRWVWRLRRPTKEECALLPPEIDDAKLRVFDEPGTPCVAGWFFPVIAVPSSVFQELNRTQWRWLMRHEGEHLRCHDTVAVLIQHMHRVFLWWNPFVHALIEEYARAREEACDAAAVAEDRERTAYAGFLLAWAAKPGAPHHGCVMPMAQSLPARRLKQRLTALMEARGVRKKVGVLFVLACAAGALLVPMMVASVGIAAAGAQEVEEPVADDGQMHTRVYRVPPDFLSDRTPPVDPFAQQQAPAAPIPRLTARLLLESKGVSFPPGASALFQFTTSQLIVRNSLPNLALVERVVDAANTKPVLVHMTCKLIQAEQYFGTHGEVLSSAETTALVQGQLQQRGVDLISAPSVTTRFDQPAIVEVVREVLPKAAGAQMKFVGPSIKLLAKAPVQGRCAVNVKVDLGMNLASETPWLPTTEQPADWDNVRIHTAAAEAQLLSGETLVLHIQTSRQPVTVLVTAQALLPDGKNADSFATTLRTAPPARTAQDVPEEKGESWAVRNYRVPPGFGGDQKPLEYLQANGIPFPSGADAKLEGEKLIVRNTQANLKLIEALAGLLLAVNKQANTQIHLSVKVVDVKGDAAELMPLLYPDMKREPGTAAPLSSPNQFTVQGILTAQQLEKVFLHLARSRHLVASLPGAAVKSGHEAVFDIPQQKGRQIKATPVLGADGNTIELTLQAASVDPPQVVTTAVTIWDGQTVILAGPAAEQDGVQRVIFVSAQMFAPAGKQASK